MMVVKSSPMEGPPDHDDEQVSRPDASARFELDGLSCRIVCVDGVMPVHEHVPGSTRMRLHYAPGELSHFAVGGHRYALLAEDGPAEVPNLRADRPLHEMLTNRELQIVQLICHGLLTKQVSDRLRISEFTVRSYLKTIYCKLGVRSRGAMVYAYARSFAARATRDLATGEE